MHPQEQARVKTFTRRAILLAGGQAALMAVLAGRLYYLQVTQADRYTMLAEENRINLQLLPPTRGRVFDRAGTLLAENKQNYRILMIPEQAQDVPATLDGLGATLPISADERARIIRDVKTRRHFVPVTVREHLDWSQVSRIEVNRPNLPGVFIDVGQVRHYPYGAPFAHVLGYVAAVSSSELTGDPVLELPDFRIGKNGVERTHDLVLRGRAGNLHVEVNAHGRVIRELDRDEGERGADVSLTIDAGLQQFMARRLEGESAGAALLSAESGEVLALASTPGFDPNLFNQGLSHQQWSRLVENPRAPLTNKAIAGQYSPGSTFKLVVALAALDAGVIGAGHRVYCPGFMKLGNRRFHCWKRGGHGHLSLVDALAQSCDVYFYDIALKLGISRIAAMAERLGLGAPLDFDLPGEARGLIPTPEWKLATRGKRWQKGETLNVGIGQGSVLTTPLQLAVMTARIVNGGRAIKPYLTKAIGNAPVRPAPPERLDIAPAALETVRDGMNRVVNHRKGTAHGARIEDEDRAMGGKTGTTQVRRITKKEREQGIVKNEDRPWEHRDHALFVGYAPVDQPRYVVAVVVEHGGGGSKVAAPIARDILIEAQARDPLGRDDGQGHGAGQLAAAPERRR